MTAILRCSDLCVAYGGRPVLSSVSLSLGVGFYGLWGANGTGKSTLLRMLSGSARPDHGDVWINGKHLVRDDVAARQSLAYVPDEAAVYPFMTGHDLMALCAWARKAPDIAPSIIEGFGLAPHLDKRYDALSLGTRRKMLIASAFIGEPSLLLMDEPANGLDAQSHAFFGALLAEKSRIACVLLSTHDGAFLETMGATIIRQESLGAS